MQFHRLSLLACFLLFKGEFGIVYKAQFHSKTQKSAESQTVAVKTLKGNQSTVSVSYILESCIIFLIMTGFFTQQHIDDMIQESKKMFHLDHPNVQKLLGVCIDGGATPFIVMPFMKNGSLISYLRKNKEKLFIRKSESNDYQVFHNIILKTLTCSLSIMLGCHMHRLTEWLRNSQIYATKLPKGWNTLPVKESFIGTLLQEIACESY